MDPSKEAPMHKNRTTTMGRINGVFNPTSLFKDVNLASKLYEDSRPLKSLMRFGVPQPTPPAPPHGSWKDWPFTRVITQTFAPAEVGQAFGPTWATHWFKVEIEVPPEWASREVHLRWITGSEATVWSAEGVLLQGLNPKFREEFPLPAGTTQATFYVEMACNHIMGAGPDYVNGWGDEITPPSPNLFFTLSKAEIALFREDIFQVTTDLEMLHGMANDLGETHIGYQAMFVANQMVNLIEEDMIEEAHDLAQQFFSQGPGQKAHTLFAMGHCHIDTAWLWPYDETVRKCARSFSSQLPLMDKYPEYKFVCSQAQQLQWVKDYYPDLYNEIKRRVVDTKQFLPVGGTWCEMDGNVPSGEAFMRQYLYGQQFFRQEFGVTCKEFWLPDTFGYSAQIPQMLKHVAIDRFLTQKMSWNLINKFPNHCFRWEGIDGSQVMCHFPPGDSYGMDGAVDGFLKSQNNSEDKGRCNSGIYLFGHGDGGGGPTKKMIERIRRVQNVDGMPKVEFSTPDLFFEAMQREEHKFYKWVGELYLELHNGTYTSQAKIKWYNRKCEFFLREVENLMSIAYSSGKLGVIDLVADMKTMDANWKNVLLNQFHDVLPGSCIQLVAEDAWRIYEGVFASLTSLRNTYYQRILGNGTFRAVHNILPWEVNAVMFMKPDALVPPAGPNVQQVTLRPEEFENESEGRFRIPHQFSASLLQLSPSGFTAFNPIAPSNSVTYTPNSPSQGWGTFSNGLIQLEVFLSEGRPQERLLSPDGTPVFTNNDAGMLYLFKDIPLIWDAWDVMDYHLETRKEPTWINSKAELVAEGPLVGVYKWTASFGSKGSSIERYTSLRANSPYVRVSLLSLKYYLSKRFSPTNPFRYFLVVDWKEDHKLLKVEWPLDILSRTATYEIQYGHTKRPTHMNTSWDMAKFEVCGHKWVDISQADKGISFITDSKYGWHVRDGVAQLSLLRSPKNPDGNCDMHKHYIHYAVLPHKGTFQEEQVIRRAYELNVLGANNVPFISSDSGDVPNSWVIVDNEAVIVEAVKVAALTPRALCIRLYESHGGYASTKVKLGFNIVKVEECNGLEDIQAEVPSSQNEFSVDFKPFQIRSFLVSF